MRWLRRSNRASREEGLAQDFLDVLRGLKEEVCNLRKELCQMFEDLADAVAEVKQEQAAAKALIINMASKIQELASRPNMDQATKDQLSTWARELKDSSDDLANAIVQNTPSAEQQVPTDSNPDPDTSLPEPSGEEPVVPEDEDDEGDDDAPAGPARTGTNATDESEGPNS